MDALSCECFSTEANPNSCYATPDRSACAAFIKESRIKFASATNLDRNSGERSGGTCFAPSPTLDVINETLHQRAGLTLEVR